MHKKIVIFYRVKIPRTNPGSLRAPIGAWQGKTEPCTGSVGKSPQYKRILENGLFYRAPKAGWDFGDREIMQREYIIFETGCRNTVQGLLRVC